MRGRTWGRASAALFTLGACGDVKDAVDARPGDDAVSSDGAQSDAMIDAAPARCDRTKPWAAPVAVTGFLVAQTDDEGAWLSNDELTMYFASNRPGGSGGFDIYTTTRPTTSAAWGTAALVAGVNSQQTERRPTLSPDGLALYASRPNGATDLNIVVATRTSTAGTFSAMTDEPSINGANSDESAYVQTDRSMVFSSQRSGNYEIYTAQWTGTVYSQIAMLPGLESPSGDGSAMLTADKLEVFFASNRAPSADYDLWTATRSDTTMGFSPPTRLTDLSASATDYPNWISPDGCVLYFTRRTLIGSTPAYYQLYSTIKPL